MGELEVSDKVIIKGTLEHGVIVKKMKAKNKPTLYSVRSCERDIRDIKFERIFTRNKLDKR